MKSICLFIITLIFFASCTCPPKLADGTKPKCYYTGPSIQFTGGFNGISVGVLLYGDLREPTITIPVNKHDPEPILTK